jgi:non-specific serine/threonine protein kinase
MGDKEIATRLGVSVRTAQYHVGQIRSKLGFASRVQVAVWVAARRAVNGLRSDPPTR